jgi:cytochrome c-type biogenesis protein CcmE
VDPFTLLDAAYSRFLGVSLHVMVQDHRMEGDPVHAATRNPAKARTAAEKLKWILRPYPGSKMPRRLSRCGSSRPKATRTAGFSVWEYAGSKQCGGTTMKNRKFIVGGTIIFFILAILIYQGLNRSMMAYVDVRELDKADLVNTEVAQVTGIVQPGSVVQNESTGQLTFVLQDMEDPEATVKVRYRGILPDNFKPGLQVVVQGRIQEQEIVAEQILTKCPSKYNTEL